MTQQQILIIKLGALGDIMLAVGAMRDIRENHPAAEIFVLTHPSYKSLLERCPWIDKVILDARKSRWNLIYLWQLKKVLQRYQFDRVYDLQNTKRTAFYYRWILSNKLWSATIKGCASPYLSKPIKSVPVLQRHAQQLEAAGVEIKHTYQPDVSFMADDMHEYLQGNNINQPFIVLFPSSSARHPEKRWSYFVELANCFIKDDYNVVTIPGPGELELCLSIPGITLGKEKPLNLFELAGVVKQARFVVGNDTGPSHIAAHMNVPGLAIFGPNTSPTITCIERKHFKAIQTDDLSMLKADIVYNQAKKLIT